MKRSWMLAFAVLTAIVVFVVLLEPWNQQASPVRQAKEVVWQMHESKEGGYRVELPGDPEPKEMAMELPLEGLPGLKVVGKGIELKRDELPGYFFVCHFGIPLPPEFLDKQFQKINYALAAAMVKEYGGTVFNIREVPVEGGKPLTELEFEFKDGKHVHRHHSHFYYHKQRFYQVAGLTLKEKAPAPFVKRFLDSFAFTK